MILLRRFLAWLLAGGIVIVARFATAVQAKWEGCEPRPVQRVYFANHCSHGDFVLLWTVLPLALRRCTRPVAGADYWDKTALRYFIGHDVFRSVLIQRNPQKRKHDPVQQMAEVLDAGESLIVFPEGTRNTGDSPLLPFKSGLFHLASARPGIDLVPVWISNLNRVLPKGEVIPIPLLCSITFGVPLARIAGESKAEFLCRAEHALLALAMREAGNDAEAERIT